jgi:hypothetical protein
MNKPLPIHSATSTRNISFIISAIFMVGVFIYILSLIMNPRASWVLPEAFYYKSYIMQSVPLHKFIEGAFNNQVFEYSDRITRPFSSILEIFDTHFRAWLWQYVNPITSLSLTFIFSLFIGPVLFYKVLKNIGIRPAIAVFATAIMMLNPGSLSLIVMLFRPAKVMMNFWLICSLYTASLIYLNDTGIQPGKNVLRLSVLTGIFTIFGFLFDETGIVIPIAILCLFPSVFFRSKQRFFGFAIVPAILILLYLVIFPAIAAHYGYGKPNLLDYQPFLTPNFPPFPMIISNLLQNSKDIFVESFGLFSPFAAMAFKLKLLFTFLFITTFFFIDRFITAVKNNSDDVNSVSMKFLIKTALLIFTLLIFHTLLLESVGNPVEGRVWGPYWYGAYFGIFMGIGISLIGEIASQAAHKIPLILVLMMSVMCIALMSAFPYTNFIYRDYHFYPYHPNELEQLYRGKINRFELYAPKMFGGKGSVTDIWHSIRHGNVLTSIPKEYYWIPLEMGVLNQYPIPNNITVTGKNSQNTQYTIPLLND